MQKHPIQVNKIHAGPRGWSKKLIEIHGEQAVYNYWYTHGNRKTAEYFGVTPWVISHCVRKYLWTRPLENATNILWGIARGTITPKQYPHLTFTLPGNFFGPSNDEAVQRFAYYLLKKETFIGWCLLNSWHTYCNSIFMWMRGDKKMDWVESYDDLIQAMKEDKSGYFTPRHFNKVDQVYTYYLKRETGFHYTIPVHSQKTP